MPIRPKFSGKLTTKTSERIQALLNERKVRVGKIFFKKVRKSYSGINATEWIQTRTKLVGKALGEECKTNNKLRALLEKYNYTIIDRNGKITETNLNRVLGIGRIRLENPKILSEKY